MCFSGATKWFSYTHTYMYYFSCRLLQRTENLISLCHTLGPYWISILYISCCSVIQLYLTLCDPMDCSSQSSLSFTISQCLLKLMSVGGVCNFICSVSSQRKFEATDQRYSPQTDLVTALGQISVTALCYSSVLFRQ